MAIQVRRSGSAIQKINLLLCGLAKTGKTTLGCSFPNVLVWAFEPGLLSVVDKDVPFIEFTAISTRREATVSSQVHEYVASLKRESGEMWELVNKLKVRTIFLDSISAYSDLLENDTIVKPFDGKDRTEALQIQDYNWIQNRIYQTLRDMAALPFNFVASAGLDVRPDDKGRRRANPSAAGEKLGPRIPHFFDDVFILDYDTRANKYTASPQPTVEFGHAGSRSHVPLKVYENPTYDTFAQYWEGGGSGGDTKKAPTKKAPVARSRRTPPK